MLKKQLNKIIIFFLITLTGVVACKEKGKENKIILFGDSLMSGYGLNKEYHLSKILENNLFNSGYKVKVINRSVSGDTTSDGLKRIDQILNDKDIDLIVLCLGANDMLQRINPIETERNLNKIIDLINNKEINIIIAGIKAPLSTGISYSKKFNPIFKKLSKKYKLNFIPFLLEGVAMRPDYNLNDGLHPNEKGVKIIAKNIKKKIIKIIK